MPEPGAPPRWPLCRVSLSDASGADGRAEVLLELWCERWLDEGGEAIVALDGELCHYTAPQAVESLRWLAQTADSLVLDLSAVTFIDAGGVSALVELWKLTTDRDSGWELRSPSPTVGWVLELVSLDGSLLASQPSSPGAVGLGVGVFERHAVARCVPVWAKGAAVR